MEPIEKAIDRLNWGSLWELQNGGTDCWEAVGGRFYRDCYGAVGAIAENGDFFAISCGGHMVAAIGGEFFSDFLPSQTSWGNSLRLGDQILDPSAYAEVRQGFCLDGGLNVPDFVQAVVTACREAGENRNQL